ncbi:sel1 repeat family protein [Thalassotalea euphylliae]|uniref:Sel1 repeat family protein n=1 Tax=Thalassotalea euphylliae TaxID=1655234 RepID=A0A3E0TKS5_9GAMM|nr:sel1 repeat family protein [Thalassotalea euphylliae]REL25154.1 sel1 repeat family protein [Thalassotalea euphylliae]
MKTLATLLFGLCITSTSALATTSNANLIDVDTYKEEYQSALTLYQSKDYEKALAALEVIAMRGEKQAQYILGTMYLNSQGTNQDLLKSYAWLSVANEQKSKQWKKPLAMLNEKLPADYLALAKEQASHYQAQYGAKAQKMKCRNTKTLGSKKPTHLCTKSEVKDGFYYISNPALAAN